MNSREWAAEKERKKLERDMRKFQRSMSTPILRGEVLQLGEAQLEHIASLALAVEVLEALLIEHKLLKEDELIDRMKAMALEKRKQAEAARVQQEPQDSNVVLTDKGE